MKIVLWNEYSAKYIFKGTVYSAKSIVKKLLWNECSEKSIVKRARLKRWSKKHS